MSSDTEAILNWEKKWEEKRRIKLRGKEHITNCSICQEAIREINVFWFYYLFLLFGVAFFWLIIAIMR